MATSKMLVRLKPFAPKRGHVLRRYVFRGVRFESGRWYEVDLSTADYLRDCRQEHNDADSPLAFDVCTTAEAKDLVRRERIAEEERRRRSAGLTIHRARGDAAAREVNLDDMSDDLNDEAPDTEEPESGGALTSTDVSGGTTRKRTEAKPKSSKASKSKSKRSRK